MHQTLRLAGPWILFRKVALLGATALFLTACPDLFPPPPFQAELASPLQVQVAPGGEARAVVRVRFTKEAFPLTLTVRLADPCAKGTSSCPGWDASRYPGVEHPREPIPVDASEEALTFRVDPTTPGGGPFKYELVLSGTDSSGRTVEQTLPFYLKVVRPGERTGMEAWNFWRAYADLPPMEEDPEWSYRAWLHSRYAVMNYPNNLPHDEDLSQPFASPEGREAGRRGNEWGYFWRQNSQPVWPEEERGISWWIAAPFHRFNMVNPRAYRGGFGLYRDAGPVPGYDGFFGRSRGNLPNFYDGNRPTREVVFPVPGKVLPLNRFNGRENPTPTAPCSSPDRPPKPPFLTQTGLTWDDGTGRVVNPIGFPLTIQAFPSSPVDTEVLEARLVRLSDGAENPVCAYGSLQYWEGRDEWRDRAVRGLRGYGALIVLPHQPLTPGAEYEAHVRARIGGQEREWRWRFTVAGEGSLLPLAVPRVEERIEEVW